VLLQRYGETGVRDYHWLIEQFSQFSDRSLVTRELFVSHAAFDRTTQLTISYFTMITQGFQHHNINIGDVLWVGHSRETESVFRMDTRLKTQLKQSGINNRCNGFVIDDDMAVKLESYLWKNTLGANR